MKKKKTYIKKIKRAKKIRRVKKAKRAKRVKIVKKAKKVKVRRAVKIKKPSFASGLRTDKQKMVFHKPQKFDLSANAIFRPKIRVIGVGGGGGSIVSEIGRSLEKASFVIADTDIRAIGKKPGIKYFYFGKDVTHGLGTGMNPELARQAAEKEKEKITKLLEGQDIIILVSSLGGGLGSGATPVFAELSQKLGNVTLGIFTLPFRFEGKKKSKISSKSVRDIRECLNALIVIPNERIFKIIGEKTSITEAFSLVNKNLIESLESLIDLIYNPGLINIDFADVRTILKGRGMMAFLNSAEATGKNRAEEVVQNILNNPLYNSNIKAEKMLFNISGGKNLGMIEVEKISKSISILNPKAKIIFGISKNTKSKNKIKTTLLITGPSFAPTPEPVEIKKPIIVKKEEKKKVPKKKIKMKIEKNLPALLRQPASLRKALLAGKELQAGKKIKKQSFHAPVIKTSVPIVVSSSTDKTEDKKGMIRRNALEVKTAQELEENKRINQEAEWEIPAFLRRMKPEH
ncbi:cell division FtsZ family protein [Patescibacteria group bacterium]|nr:cell division FtsZ family protein [Patescibacteria group bacterium]